MSAKLQTAVLAPRLGIIAGAGDLPRSIMHACAQSGRSYYVLAIEGAAEEETVAQAETEAAWVRIGAIGKAMQLLREHGCTDLVFAGKVKRPKIASLRPDLKGTMLLARIGTQLLAGDNTLLSGIITFFEEEGFNIVGAEEVVKGLLAPVGLIGSIYPDKRAQGDIEFGARIARGIGALDIGQSVVVQNHQVVGVEAIEGTDKLIERCAGLKPEEKGGVLVKLKKPQQDGRIDLPTIGVATVERVAAAGLEGIAVEAGATLLINRREIARRADALGIFVIGFTVDE